MVLYRNKRTGLQVRMSAPLRAYENSPEWERVSDRGDRSDGKAKRADGRRSAESDS